MIEKGEFINGEKVGEWITYNKTGKLTGKINYKNGLPDGKAELFYLNGKRKLIASFEDGKKEGTWEYFTEKGKLFMSGLYKSGKPSGIWTINDYKGKKNVVVFDYSTNKYILNNPYGFHKDNSIVQNINTEEWYILRIPTRAINEKSAPLGGFIFAGDLFIEMVEVPLDYWDTYVQYDYKAQFTIGEDNSTTFKLTDSDGKNSEDKPGFPFLIITNPESKIKKIEHSKLSKDLLNYKIKEALNFMPPWVYNGSKEVEVNIPYVINKISFN